MLGGATTSIGLAILVGQPHRGHHPPDFDKSAGLKTERTRLMDASQRCVHSRYRTAIVTRL